MTKQQIICRLVDILRQQLITMTDAAQAAHDASTGENSKQEGKYDTRGLEASYLADAQAEQTQKLKSNLHVFESLQLADYVAEDLIGSGALVETESEGIISYYLLTPCAGGLSIDYEGGELTTLSPEAPFYQKLLGGVAGDLIDDSDIIILNVL